MAHFFAVGVVGHFGAGVADDGEAGGEAAFEGEAVEGGDEFAFGEVAVGAEDDEGAGFDLALEAEGVVERVVGAH